MSFPFHAYIVSLKRDRERRLKLIPQLHRLGIDHTWSAGVLVKLEDCRPEEYCSLEAYHSDTVRRDSSYITAVTGARRAQLRALRKAHSALHVEDWVLMLEDDVILPAADELQDVVDRLRYIEDSCPIVLLYRADVSNGSVDEHGIVTVDYWSRGHCAYLVRPGFIPELIDTITNLGSESDMCWEDLISRGYKVKLINCVLSNQKESNIIGNIEQLKHLRK